MVFLNNKIKSILGNNKFSQINFIICGTQKGGTTALDAYLRTHSDICMADKKEVHYFDTDRYFKDQNPNYKKYHKYFSPRDENQIIGEATPIYMYWDQAIERIHEYNSKIKLIIILRNPIDRAFSHWNMERDKGRESRSFWQAIVDEESKINSSDRTQDKRFSYLDRGYYSSQIKNIYKYFKEDQLLVLRNDLLRVEPDRILMHIARFLAISSFKPIKHREVNSRDYPVRMNKSELTFLKNFYEEEFDSLEDLLDWDLSSWRK